MTDFGENAAAEGNGDDGPDDVIDEAATEAHGSVTFEISSYGADYTVDSLVKRVRNKDFYLPPFQRAYVWSQRQASRFIESLMLGLPVPGIFVYREDATKRHLIIDGNQRLKSIQFFFDGTFKKQPFQLIDVDPRWLHKTFKELDDSDRRTLEDAIIHTTVFRQDQPNKNIKSVYEVFERLNTGGVKLQAQEIRHCVSYGSFVKLLEKLNDNYQWRAIYGAKSKRLKDRELILRFLALLWDAGAYKKPMRDFLDGFISNNQELGENRQQRFENDFRSTIDVVFRSIGEKAFRPEKLINAAVFDSVMVGVARRAGTGPVTNLQAIKDRYNHLLSNENFKSAYARATSDEENVRRRLDLATEAFADV